MSKNIYALLVGIDAYQPPVTPLQGCVNDILAVTEYLQGRVNQGDYQLHLKTLLNQDATRQGIIDGFHQHLSQAISEDIALFYYAGHGSQEQAPPEFWHVEPDRLNETIVCYDSRTQGSWDLADKELNKLISELSLHNPHTVIIMDCCHSGSGTRGELALDLDIAVRKAPLDQRQRPLDSFIVKPTEIEPRTNSRSLEADSHWLSAQGKYIFLAACRDRELAKEYNTDGSKRGVFSYFLLDTLTKANGSLTYRDLFKRADALVRSKVTAQSPQIESQESAALDQPFLGGAVSTHRAYFTVSHQPDYGWVIDGGAVHGMSPGTNGETAQLAIFPFNSSVEELSQPDRAIATAQVLKVMPQLSQIEVGSLQPGTTYKAIVTSLPLPPKGVVIKGEQAGVTLARQALKSKSSPHIVEVAESQGAEWQLLAQDNQYIITRPVDDRPLVAEIAPYNEGNARQAIERLEHLTRWTNIAELSSPVSSRIPADAVKMSIYQDEQELISTNLRLYYAQHNGEWQQPTFKVQLTNTSNLTLYCALLDLTDRYEVSAELLATGGVWLEPGDSAWALDGQAIYAKVDKEMWQQRGITEAKDILKLIVSTAEFDATLLEQNELDLPTRNLTAPKRGSGTLNHLMSRVQTRGFSSQAETEAVYDDWMTSQVHITTIRPQETTAVPSSESRALGVGVTIEPHPIQAQVRLTTSDQGTRDLAAYPVPAILTENPNLAQPWQFTTSRGGDPGLNVLELTEVQNPETVTKEQPLKLIVDTSLAENEQLLPIAHDGEFFLPLGWGKNIAGGKTEINLTRLPSLSSLNRPASLSSATEEETRSLGGSLRILFQKILSQKLPHEFKYPLLAIADVSPDETVNYIQDLAQVKARVAESQRIILYIHGIIGDTEDMVRSVRRAKFKVSGESKRLGDIYDLVLTFDYENLHTPIEENARLLKQRLEQVGLGANHGKKIHIVAHSMGGLVSRWFIEREGGNAIANHLIMLGTPNGGSPWSTIEDWAVTLLGIGLNGLSTVTWSVPILGALMKVVGVAATALEAVDVSLDQMKPESKFLNNLASSPDPGIPYSIVAGNTSIIPAALASQENQPSLIKRLREKLFDQVIDLAFLRQPNDIAVNVNSDRIYPPQIQEVGCDHMVYFYHPQGIRGLSLAIIQAWKTKK